MLKNFPVLSTNDYAACYEILGIPLDVEWSDLQVHFGFEEFGSVTLKLLITGDQMEALSRLANKANLSHYEAETD